MAKRTPVTDVSERIYGGALERLTGKPVGPPLQREPAPPLEKVTFYLPAEKVVALEELKLKVLKVTGRKLSRSQLVEQALDLLLSQSP